MRSAEQKRIIEEYQRKVAEALGVTLRQYQGSDISPSREWPDGGRVAVGLKWFGLPRTGPAEPLKRYGCTICRVDRSAFPYFKLIDDEDNLNIRPFPLIPYAWGRVWYRVPHLVPQENHGDVLRLTWRFWRWRGVLALYAWSRFGYFPRFGIDLVSQIRGKHWHQVKLRLYKP